MFNAQKPTVKQLQEKSKNIVSLFARTVEDLNNTNFEIMHLTDVKQEQKSNLETDISILTEQKLQNEKTISKINNIIN